MAETGREMKFAGILSTYATIEEMYLFKKLMERPQGGPIGVLSLTRGEQQKFPSGFTIEADKTPNRAFAAKLFGEEAIASGVQRVVQELQAGTVRGLLVMNGIPDFALPADLVEAAKKAAVPRGERPPPGPARRGGPRRLPGTAWAEKDGTFMNFEGRVQRIRKAVEPPVHARPEAQWLQEALVALGARPAVTSIEGVFREAMPGYDYGKIGNLGVKTNGTA